ncbi:MAG TPA: phytase [Saprospiraceae bacterium]|nr:phytase [Saprospiraceae bacterium]HMQ83598.1 phytase [Saprospiraceae bacterium]
MKLLFNTPATAALGFVLLLGVACKNKSKQEPTASMESGAQVEAREDSLALIAAYQRQEKIALSVQADRETKAVDARIEDDAADDPAIWVDSNDPSRSMIIGSNKKGGIETYDLEGNEIAYYPVGRINNVDVAYQVKMGARKVDIVGGSNRSDQSIAILRIDPTTRHLVNATDGAFLVDTALMDDVYGFCFYQSKKNGVTYALLNAKNGRFQQYLLTTEQDTLLGLKLVREVKFDSQVEGMVADSEYGIVYIGEEDRGVWKMDAEPDGSSERQLIPMSGSDNPNIAYDVEGLTLYERGRDGYLVVSSQGNFSYAVFDRKGSNPYLFSFKILGTESTDGVEETDGIQAISDSLGIAFPNGLLIAQDGFNKKGDQPAPQNFKLVDWRKIEALIK